MENVQTVKKSIVMHREEKRWAFVWNSLFGTQHSIQQRSKMGMPPSEWTNQIDLSGLGAAVEAADSIRSIAGDLKFAESDHERGMKRGCYNLEKLRAAYEAALPAALIAEKLNREINELMEA